MQLESSFSAKSTEARADCIFCQRASIVDYILQETTNFRIVADHAPLLEGHILIIPKRHFTCYGDVPADLDSELFALKHEVQRFFARYYDRPVFWEHGIFHQTVFHAHLHCFPFGEITYNPAEQIHERIISSQDEIRSWHASHGHYFYLEDKQSGYLFAPDMGPYQRIIREVLWPGVSAHPAYAGWRSPQQRQEEGKLLIASTIAKWQAFQQG